MNNYVLFKNFTRIMHEEDPILIANASHHSPNEYEIEALELVVILNKFNKHYDAYFYEYIDIEGLEQELYDMFVYFFDKGVAGKKEDYNSMASKIMELIIKER